MRALAAMPAALVAQIFTPQQQELLGALVDIDLSRPVPDLAAAADAELRDVEVLLTGWGSPMVDAAALARMPRLRAVVHTAGTVRFVVSDAVWEQGDVVVTSATEANAVPVAEYTLAQILLAGKRTLQQEAAYRRQRQRAGTAAAAHAVRRSMPRVGAFGAVVGLIGASRIGCLVAEHLQRFDLEVLISDPYVDAQQIEQLGATKVELPELFSRSDVVSLHAPDVPSTRGMVSAELLALMQNGTTFINTARPALVDEDALRAECVSGRIAAVLDVHEDLSPDDALWEAPTVSITPHIAGSQGNELHRMGEAALEEVRRLSAGEPPRWPVDRAARGTSA
ncbi:hydroxyacid dehydrogenase [Brachybacterium sp. p3-SID957]|uniref:hydroxyacid dehydrogenase n=1 Tax=Brachybacterium sp. p3-SID957 TaxID=2916049 RepID=UPI00223C1423|nr:hydroxyacid dehydrogenase [Brachybacterium sp. p3-SID957]MCT1776469.1 hydroxyacid dehydrogenase [Brachybacterium sp. p3-SID957]